MKECSYKSIEELRAAADGLGVELALSEDISVLDEPLELGSLKLPNRFCVQPMECADADPDGAPGELTSRRYVEFAQGGFGLIWVEAVAVSRDGMSNHSQLILDRDNVEEFKEFTGLVREAGVPGAKIIVQLTHSGRFSITPVDAAEMDEADIDELRDSFLASARLAQAAGFDGVDIKCCHGCLLSDIVRARGNAGVLLKIVSAIRSEMPGMIVTSRLGVEDEPGAVEKAVKLTEALSDEGLEIINISVENTFLASGLGKAEESSVGSDDDMDPLRAFARAQNITGKIQKAVPGVAVVGGSFSWFRTLALNVAAGMIDSGACQVAGFGRSALACPDLPSASVPHDPSDVCIACSSCIQLLRDGGRSGCVMKDDFYAAEYRNRRAYTADELLKEAARCHRCEDASCSRACPAGIDVPGFIGAFADGDLAASFDTLRESNLLPGICSNLCPVSMMCEGACVENRLSGNPVRIHSLQYAVSCAAGRAGLSGARIPDETAEGTAAIVGCGPAGISAAVRLVEKGHRVVIFERRRTAGGTPSALIDSGRFPDSGGEIEDLLAPALKSGRLQVRYGEELGGTCSLDGLKGDHDSVLIASGLWQELPLDGEGGPAGVVDAVTFLDRVKSSEITSVHGRVVLLAGGDCAMDAASLVMELGADELYVVYGGTRAEMHWHKEEEWFATPGVNLMVLSDPVGYASSDGVLDGVRVMRVDPETLEQIAGSEFVLEADMVIEAVGLGVEESARKALAGLEFSEYGLLKTATEESFATAVDGVYAAGGIINGGASVAQCVAEGMKAADEMHEYM
jgi:NADPH-dependent glutamate synthase beta subunit-like oxidoreductase/2,4-dienoyl-CoA reductase-like NADH-dependent reductase (Old Yellow Enzyme family)